MKALRIAVIVLGVLLVAMIIYYLWSRQSAEPPVVVVPEKPSTVPAPPEPVMQYPLPEAASSPDSEEPLPELSASDPFMQDLLAELYSEPSLMQLLIPREFIRRMVLIIDALPRQALPRRHLPMRPPAGTFQVAEVEAGLVIDSENARRYHPYVQLAEAVPPSRLADVYVRIYPLLQEAYRELGHQQGYFNDRMIVVLDHLLATPQIDEPLALVEHVNRYLFADSSLENLSAGRKILLRMGSENAGRIKDVLRQFRDRLAASETGDKSSSGDTM